MRRIIIITGKGGVGKTSVAAAHALKSADEGEDTLLVSTDMAHNLGDLFGCPIGNTVTELSPHLFGLELDPGAVMQEDFSELNHAVTALFTNSEAAAGKLAGDFLFPGTDLLFCLLKIASLYESGRFTRIIVDCAPTGETLALLKLPELLSWYMEKFFPVGKTMVRSLSLISEKLYRIELPTAEGMDDIARLHRKLTELQKLLKDPSVTSVRIVCTPEKMVVAETRRSYMYLNLYGYQTDGVFINRILPASAPDPFFSEWKRIQAVYLKELSETFASVPVTRLFRYPEELCSADALRQCVLPALASDPSFFSVRTETIPESYEPTENGFCMNLHLPAGLFHGLSSGSFTGSDDGTFAGPDTASSVLSLNRNGQDLSVTLANAVRRFILPDTLADYTITGSKIKEDRIQIFFAAPGRKEASCES